MTDPLTKPLLSFEQLRADVAERLRVEPSAIAADDDLSAAGLDSIELMVLTERWRDAGLRVSYIELAESPRLRDWWALISG